MLATIKVVRKTPTTAAAAPVYNPATRTWSGGTFTTIADNVKARIQPYGIIGDITVGQDTTGRRLIRVQIENTVTGIQPDDHLIVTSCPDNSELTGYLFEVRGALASSNAWHTELVCEADVKANP